LLLTLLLVTATTQSQSTNPQYDSVLAKKLGADEYGMKKYVLVILKTGTNIKAEEAFIDSCFSGHMDNMKRLVKEGKLIVAGPISKNDKTYRGIFILNVATAEEAEKIVQTDPAIKAKLLDAEIYNWYGSAALPEYLEESDKIWKKNF
jgi:uncharacterized protein YciI